MRRIEWKSFLAGVSLALAVILGIGAAQPNPATPPVGRFWIEAGELSRAYVIDTATGQVWESSNRDFHGPKIGGGEQ